MQLTKSFLTDPCCNRGKFYFYTFETFYCVGIPYSRCDRLTWREECWIGQKAIPTDAPVSIIGGRETGNKRWDSGINKSILF